jgi:tetratricopeptide (TPR) repeat protein
MSLLTQDTAASANALVVDDLKPDKAEHHLHRGRERSQNGEFRQALIHFSNGLRIDPAHAELYAERGDAYRLLGEPQQALADYDASLQLKPSALLPLMGRAAVACATGNFENARADASAALAISTRYPLAYRVRAAAAVELDDLQSALDDLTAALDIDPDDIEALHQRGQILAKFGEADRAVRDFSRVLDINPHHVGSLLHRAHARRSRGEYARAIRDYTDVLRLHPGNALAFTSRGLTHELNSDRDSALADHNEALRLEPENVQVYLNRAKLYRVKGDLVRARADLDEVLRRHSEHFAALYHRAKIALAQAQWQQALNDLDAVVTLKQDLGVAFASRAVIRDRLNQFEEALVDSSRAIELERTSATAHLARGLVYAHMRESARAIPDLTEAIRLDDQNPLAYQERTVAWALQGDHDRALADVNRLIDLEPGNAFAYAQRSMILHVRGEVQPALVDYARALQLDPCVLLSGWNQTLSDQLRNQSAIVLADAIDGLRSRRNFASAPAAPEWTIVVEKARSSAPPRAERSLPSSPVLRGRAAGGEGAEPAKNAAPLPGVTNPRTPALSPGVLDREKLENRQVKTASIPAAKPASATTPQSQALAETLTDAAAVPIKNGKTKGPARKPDPVAVVEDRIDQLQESSEFEEEVDLAIEALFADEQSAPGPPPASAAATATPIEFAKPATAPAPSPAPAAKSIDCPLCHHRLPPAETLSGGRFRCGNCNAVFFPGASPPPPATVTWPAPAKARPAKQAAKLSRDDDEADSTFLAKWKKPTPLAITGIVALVLLYFYFPTDLFGGPSRYAVHRAKGEATFDSKPIANASIIFYPIDPKTDDHPRPKATVGANGSFTLGTYSGDDGAPEGEYKVSIVWNAAPTPKEIQEDRYRPRNQLPAHYANPETSGLTARIAAGDNQLPAFVLKRK